MRAHAEMEFRALRGTEDTLPHIADLWTWVEARSREVFRRFGYREVRTPLLEEARLFARSVGEATDIVQKEMYVLTDQGGRRIALRPEATASLVRAYVEHEYAKQDGLVKWYYLGPMFRAERPQAGRKRQFHQIGVEAIGSSHPLIDVEVIALALTVLEAIGITRTRTRLNNVGCRADRQRTSLRLRKALTPHTAQLCRDCQARLTRNVFRVLDCKQPHCQAIVQRLEATPDACDACQQHYATVLETLRSLQIPFEEAPRMVRGLDYYTKTVFEFTHEALGAHDALGAGGRYDDLVHELGGPAVGACGFAVGLERLLLARQETASPTPDQRVTVMVVSLDEAAQREAFGLVHELRRCGIPAVMDYTARSLKGQMRSANKWGARFVALLGPQERAQAVVTLKEMATSTQDILPRQRVVTALQQKLATT